MTTTTSNEIAVRTFQIIAGTLTAFFLYYGMDVRRKEGARDFTLSAWQTLMKFCSFLLVGVAVWITFSVHQVNAGDWLDLAVMASGTAFVAAAKRGLGKAHTFTGQYLEKPMLVTRGIYAITRNPLYFGVLQCELGASLFVIHQAPELLPQTYLYWLGFITVALLYAVSFNWTMAVRESRYLESYFGKEYRRYSAEVPFFIPWIRRKKEVK
jgi:steroid 5-alpha reductase family enzyme